MTIKKIKIGNKFIGQNQPVFIIAEAGVNHNGRLDLALKLVDAAAAAHADAVKFQTFKAWQLVTKDGEMAEYQKKNIGKTESQPEMLKKLELREEFYKPILDRCKEKKIIFLSTPHGGFESVDFLHKLGLPAFKFGSGDLTNLPVLEYAAKFKKPMILGTGMATMKEVKEAVEVIKKAGNDKIIMLHCTTNYPCLLDEVNLSAMVTMINKLDVLVGYSDHTLGVDVPIMAATLGACILEKHFTLDKNMTGPDHVASAEPAEIKKIVDSVRNVKIILGGEVKKPNKSELPLIKIARKSVVAIRNIEKGEKFTKENLGIKRPGDGLPPKFFNLVVGKKARKNLLSGATIKTNDYK
ncbi:MAG: N-acetylneuraminate synthase [Candidatus Magasanikbacteria bacterium GW2011_GWC2_41_17]|uniref:N-acetylneuraminate synthase n=2 Tax=Candidatus Magasanikiibacteriota TaxID=1752731 RepID=A0A0G0ZL08_9BACT|nr:MAG: N-acetylneuraminate synthase [Candidatus Magasanikbacteria bacterium GW2011_GWC2_41_17]KKS13643.1 MAG: N-acetylneuraminate synthase [Candidatus Magasanikbacteria bacterium GW2011_GWA2_41_55]